MKTYSRRKFVQAAVISSVGAYVLPEPGASAGPNHDGGISPMVTDAQNAGPKVHADIDLQSAKSAQEQIKDTLATMRPIRKKQGIEVTVGQDEGDLQGNDDKVLQAAVDYAASMGGGTIKIRPGIYTMRNSLFPRPGITIQGSGDGTVLRKSASVSSKIIREADWFEYAVRVENPAGFSVGGGIALSRDKKKPEEVRFFTITAIKEENMLYLDKRTEADYWMEDEARASTRFSIIYGWNVDDVNISEIVLDGNHSENEHVNDNYAGAVFMQYCNRWNFKNVVAKEYNSDGFSFQVCDDIHFEDCSSINNADLGFHPGSGSQRPVFKRCVSKGNSQGFFWCWSACDGIAEDCIASENKRYGINFGHRDTDNIVRRCTVENNGEVGILFRKEPADYRQGDRNIIENCIIRDNGKSGPGLGIDIRWKTRDITIRNCRIENSKEGPQKIGIRISPEAEHITLENNIFQGNATKVEDQRNQ